MRLQHNHGLTEPVRSLCDTGAQINLIYSGLVQKLGLTTSETSVLTKGINQEPMILSEKVRVTIFPWFPSSESLSIEMLVSNVWNVCIPAVYADGIAMPDQSLVLADPDFRVPASVHMLLGAEVWAKIIEPDMYKNEVRTVVHKTTFGHVVFGRIVQNNITLSEHMAEIQTIELINSVLDVQETELDLDQLLKRLKRCKLRAMNKSSWSKYLSRHIIGTIRAGM